MSRSQQQANGCFLGMDGGGSKTVAVLLDAHGNERGRGHAGGANIRALGVEVALAEIHTAINRALAIAGEELPCTAAWIGLAGIDRPADSVVLRPHLESIADSVRLTNDAELLLGAFADAVGVALIAGTGSIAFGRNASGHMARASGWGHIMGDEGSGYDIGRMALQAVTRAADGRGKATVLQQRILATWALSDPTELIEFVHAQRDKATIARLAPLVFSAAREGDAVAARIIRHAASELAQATSTIADALDLPTPLPLALGGSLLIHNPDLCKLVLARVRRQRGATADVLVPDPALAAAHMLITLQKKEIVL